MSTKGRTASGWRAREAGKLVPRSPIRLLLGPSIVQIVSARARVTAMRRTATRRFNEEFQRDALRRAGLLEK